MFLRRTIRSFLILFLSVTSLLVMLNLLLSIYPEKIISYFLPENYSVAIEEMPSVFLPFYLTVSGLEVTSEKFDLSVRKMDLKADYKSLVNSGRFLSVTVFDGGFRYRSGRDINDVEVSVIPDIFKVIHIYDTTVKYESEPVIVTLNANSLFFDGSSGAISGHFRESSVSSDRAEQTFTGSVKARLLKQNELIVDHLKLNGKDFYINIENGKFSEGENYAVFEGAFDTEVLNIFTKIDEGKLNVKGKYDSGKLSARAELINIRTDNLTIGGFVDVYGNIFEKLLFESSKLSINGMQISCEGSFMPKSFDTKLTYRFIKQPVLFENKNYRVKLGGGNASITQNFSRFAGKFTVFSHEQYKINYRAKLLSNKLVIEHAGLKAEKTQLSGSGVFENEKLSLDFSGDVVNNKDLQVHLDFRHHLKVDMMMTAGTDSLHLTGSYRNIIPSVLYNIPTKRVSGKIDITNNNLNFTANGKLEKGKVNVAGSISRNTQNYNIQASSVPFNTILAYFKVNAEFDNPVTGNADILVKDGQAEVEGEVYFNEPAMLPSHNISYSYSSGVLNIDSLKLQDKNIVNAGFLNFKRNYLKGRILLDRFKYKDFPVLKNISFFINGAINDPAINLDFKIKPAEYFDNVSVSATGHYNNIFINARSSQFSFTGTAYPLERSIKGKIDLKTINFNGVKPDGSFFVTSSDLEKFLIKSDRLSVDYKRYETQISNFSMIYENKKLQEISGTVDSKYIKNVQIKNGIADKHKFSGEVYFDNSSLSTFFLKDAYASGSLKFIYPYEGYPGLYGDAEIYGKLYSDFAELRLRNVNAEIVFDNHSATGRVSGHELDTALTGNFQIPRYYKPLQGNAYLKANNLYVEKYGFKGTLDIEGSYSGKEKLVRADVIIKQAYFSHDEQISDSVSQKGKGGFPFKLNIDIQTAEPVQLQNKYISGGLALDLHVEKENLIDITGRIDAVNSEITVGEGSFSVTKGYIRFMENSPPFLFIDASGEENFSDLRLKIKGFLPQYEVEVRSTDPAVSSDYLDTTSNIGEKQLLSRILGGMLLKDIVGITEKVVGISGIDVDINRNAIMGGQSEYLAIGKRFSNRLRLRYMIGVSGEESFNSVVGEYTLLDWLNLFVYTTPNGGTGAGFSLLNGF